MKNTFRGILILGFIIVGGVFFTAEVSAANWYVDKDASGANNGTSWASAWKSFSSIKWGSGGVRPGDTLYISGGYSSKTYTGFLKTGISGTSSARITIRVGQDAGHNGTVIVEARGRSDGISIGNYTTIDGSVNNTIHMIVRNAGSVGIHARDASTVYGVTVKYVELADNGDSAHGSYGTKPGFAHGIRVPSAMNTEIAYNNIHGSYKDGINYPGSKGSWGSNKIHDNYIHDVGDDGVQGSGGIDAWNNVLHDGGPYRTGAHPDGFQLMGNYIRVWGNTVYDFDNSMIFWDSLVSGQTQAHGRIFNNVVFASSRLQKGYTRGIQLKAESSATGLEDAVVANNTVADVPYYGIGIGANHGPMRNVTVVNNILHNTYTGSKSGMAINIYNYSYLSNINIDYNLISAGVSGVTRIAGADSVSPQRHAIKGDPQFVKYVAYSRTNDFRLKSGSPAVGAGTDMSSLFTDDLNGYSRSRWDAGAYALGSDADSGSSGSTGGSTGGDTGGSTGGDTGGVVDNGGASDGGSGTTGNGPDNPAADAPNPPRNLRVII